MSGKRLEPGEAMTFFQEVALEPTTFLLDGGSLAIASYRCPDKQSPNEDAAAVIATSKTDAVLAVVDGCGGMASGAQAAQIVVESLVKHVSQAVREGVVIRAAILDGVEEANRLVVDQLGAAGATAAIVLVEEGAVRPFHIGDAQVMVVGGRGKIKLLTTAHSPVGYALEAGMLNEREAMDHADRHLISNLIGVEEMHVEVGSSRPLASRDGVLVASDGVFDNVQLEEITSLLSRGPADVVAASLSKLGIDRMQYSGEGAPSKPDDLALIVYTQRGVKPTVPLPA